MISERNWTTRNAHRAKYGVDLSYTEQLRNDVLCRGKTLKEIREEDPLAYQRDYRQLSAMRQLYINEFAEVPKVRMNFYIYGKGGTGQGAFIESNRKSDVSCNTNMMMKSSLKSEGRT